jgi:putative SOS response-associated peptidase YedK
MCYHTKQSKDIKPLEERFAATVAYNNFAVSDRYNGFIHPETPIICNDKRDVIQLYSWGLIPFWAKDQSFRKNTLNAKVETITELPSFRNAVKNRCLILVDGFYEWKWLDPKGKEKQQYLITLPNHEPYAIGGIYSEWTDKETGELIKSYAMITTEANELMAEIHNTKKRMPLILSPDNEKLWLDASISPNAFENCQVDLIAREV